MTAWWGERDNVKMSPNVTGITEKQSTEQKEHEADGVIAG